MTKDQATAFLLEAGHITDVETFDENVSRVTFQHRGIEITLLAFEDDSDFLCLKCSYHLDDADRNELEVSRLIARLQDTFKVVKLSVSLEEPGNNGVSAIAEQFLPYCESFPSIFWRSVDLVASVAAKAYGELCATAAAESAAERFTEKLESDLHLRFGEKQPETPRGDIDIPYF